MRRRLLLSSGAALLLLSLVAVAWGEDLLMRLQRLHREGHPDLALALYEDHLRRGTPRTEELAWMEALLVRDPDRFDRIAAELVSGKDATDPRVQGIVLARSKELFARGQYLSTLEQLRALPPEADLQHPELALYRGMAAQAVGELRAARTTLEGVAQGSPAYGQAQLLLADLRLRQGDAPEALQAADRALAVAGRTLGAQALHTRGAALERLGREDAARQARRQLLRDFPRSAEAAWLRERTVPVGGGGEGAPAFPEEEAPARRVTFALQLGAFHDRSLALRLAQAVAPLVEELRIERDNSQTPAWYRVVAGRYGTRNQAERARDALAEEGHASVLLAPGRSGP